MGTLVSGRLSVAAGCLGVIEDCLDEVLAYSKSRHQHGKPIARQDGRTITGKEYAEITVDDKTFSQPFYWGTSVPYPAVNLDHREARLTMRPAVG